MCSCWQQTQTSISVFSLCCYASDSNHDEFKMKSITSQQQLTSNLQCNCNACEAVLCCAVLCCAVLCCAVLCCAVLCCAVLCCAVLCCAVLSSATCYLVRLPGDLSHAAQRVALSSTVQHPKAQKPLQRRHHDNSPLMQRPARHFLLPSHAVKALGH